MRFCYSVNYFENMNAFADKLQFTDQILLAKIGIFFVLDILGILTDTPRRLTEFGKKGKRMEH